MRSRQIIAGYELISFLGSGGMGEVWLAQHRYTREKVAVKALHPHLINDPIIRVRFKNEAETLAKLQHSNIVAIRDYLETRQGHFLVMEYVDGMPLDDYIKKESGPIPEDQAINLFSQVLKAVGYAHHKNIVHRDIKPSNFLVTPDSRIKILDFGIAKLLEEDKNLTQSGSRLGTILYMSPEQVKGLPAEVKSDIYSLGVTLFQMVSGQYPYEEDSTEYQIYNYIMNEPLPSPNIFYPAVSSHLQAVIRKATQKAPQDRFSNCDDFLQALHSSAFGQQQPTAAKTPPSSPRPKKKRWPAWWPFCMALAISIQFSLPNL